MTVGVLTTSYPTGEDDPAGSFVRDRVRALVAAGAGVEVIAAGQGPDTPERGVRVVRVGARLGAAGGPEALEAPGTAAWGEALAVAFRLAAEATARAPGWRAVESHWLIPCGLLGTAVARGRPHRAFAHGGDVALLERLPAGDALARALRRGGAELVFVSAALRARFARLCGVSVEALAAAVEAAPVDEALFAPRAPAARAALRRRLGTERPTVLGVGRLVPIKGFDLLVRALARLAPERRPQLVIAGEGPERAALAALAARRSVTLRLLGARPRAEVADWMAAADLYAHPARVLASGREEGMPVAAREALAAGLPVVASACGGLPELGPRPGLVLVPPGDPSALAAAIVDVLRCVPAQPATHLLS